MDSVRHCVERFRSVDLMGKDVGPHVCVVVNELLQCAANLVGNSRNQNM